MKTELSPRQKEVYDLRAEGASFEIIGKRLGISESSARVFFMRARKRMDAAPVTDPVTEPVTVTGTLISTNPQSMAQECESKAAMILNHINEKKVKGATIQQCARAFSDLIQNSRLLKGEATQIISHEDRRKLKELIPAMIKEAKRRGITIDVTPEVAPDTLTES